MRAVGGRAARSPTAPRGRYPRGRALKPSASAGSVAAVVASGADAVAAARRAPLAARVVLEQQPHAAGGAAGGEVAVALATDQGDGVLGERCEGALGLAGPVCAS